MSQRLVLDASAAIQLVLRTPKSARLKQALDAAALVLVPSIYFAEVANGLWKYVSFGNGLSIDEAAQRFRDAEGLVDEVFEDRDLVTEALHQSAAHRHPVYDFLYVVLARRTGATVLTLDQRLSRLLKELDIPHQGPEREVSTGD